MGQQTQNGNGGGGTVARGGFVDVCCWACRNVAGAVLSFTWQIPAPHRNVQRLHCMRTRELVGFYLKIALGYLEYRKHLAGGLVSFLKV